MDGKPGKPELVIFILSPDFLVFRSSNSAICFIKQSEKAPSTGAASPVV